MTTKLNAPLKRELIIDDQPYMLTINQMGLKLTRKGRRKGHELTWRDFISGDAALAVALNASLASGSGLKSRHTGRSGGKPKPG